MSLSLTPPTPQRPFQQICVLHSFSPPYFQEQLRSYWTSSHKSLERWLYASPSKGPAYNHIFIVYVLLYTVEEFFKNGFKNDNYTIFDSTACFNDQIKSLQEELKPIKKFFNCCLLFLHFLSFIVY